MLNCVPFSLLVRGNYNRVWGCSLLLIGNVIIGCSLLFFFHKVWIIPLSDRDCYHWMLPLLERNVHQGLPIVYSGDHNLPLVDSGEQGPMDTI